MSSPSAIGDSGNGAPLTPQWGMTWNRRFASPVYGISSADLNDDGLEELIITTINGVSFFLPDPRTAKRRLAQAVERMREIKEMREILEQLRRDNRKLVEDRRVKEEKEREEEEERRREEAEEERRRKANEAKEEAERREKEILELKQLERKEMEELERKEEEKEKKTLEVQQLREKQQKEQGEQDKVPSNEPDHEGLETEEKEEEALVTAAVESVEEQVPAEAENQVQNDDEVGASQVIDAESTKITSVVEDEEKRLDAAELVVVGESESKDDNGETSEEVSEEQAEVHNESPEQESSEQESPEEVATYQSLVREDSTNLERHRCVNDLPLQSFENTDDEHKSGNASGSESKQANE